MNVIIFLLGVIAGGFATAWLLLVIAVANRKPAAPAPTEVPGTGARPIQRM